MADPLRLRVVGVRQYVRNVRTRMPFRYGQATLTRVPVLHLRTTVEAADGTRAEGWSADCLPPGWFDKRPGRNFRADIESLLAVTGRAIDSVLAGGLDSVFEHWLRAYQEVRDWALRRGETGLTCGFGPALVERSLIDAVGKLAGTEFHQTIRTNLLGIDLGTLHPELDTAEPADHLASEPMETVGVRHTVGLADPLTDADIGPSARVDDRLPESLEAYLLDRGIRYLKVKVEGQLDADLARLRVIAELIDRHVAGRYVVSLDGNEQFDDFGQVAALLDAIRSEPSLGRFLAAIEYLEQPLKRQVALDPAAVSGIAAVAAIKPVVIDESDDSIDALRRALALGYHGISIKNCKGVQKAVANRCLADRLSFLDLPARPYMLTGEDLMNTAAVPLQQDLCTVATVGLGHVERNGHHYVRGLDHLSPDEIAGCLSHHAGLYEPFDGNSGQLSICDGLLDLRSLRVPGYGVAFPPDWEYLTGLEDWRFDDLGLDD